MELLGTGGIVDPTRLGPHNSMGEQVGLVYTSRGGFVDIGHVRDLADQTNWIYQQITTTVRATGTTPVRVWTLHGYANLRATIPPNLWIDIAGEISYLDGLAYEIYTYDFLEPGMHSSAFSPEDLPSNFLGVYIAEQALQSGGEFDRAFESTLAGTLDRLGVMPKIEAGRAFESAEKRKWIKSGQVQSAKYLLKRNLTGSVWQVTHAANAEPAEWMLPANGMLRYSDWRDFTFDERGTTINQVEIPKALVRIAADAMANYGPNALDPL